MADVRYSKSWSWNVTSTYAQRSQEHQLCNPPHPFLFSSSPPPSVTIIVFEE